MTGPAHEPLVLLYDGTCRFCLASTKRLLRWARPGAVRPVPLQDEAAVARLPGRPETGEAMTLQLMYPDGRIAKGAAATFGVLETRPVWKLLTWIYRVPGLKQLIDWEYAFIARHRYRIMGKTGVCGAGACPK